MRRNRERRKAPKLEHRSNTSLFITRFNLILLHIVCARVARIRVRVYVYDQDFILINLSRELKYKNDEIITLSGARQTLLI